MKAIWIVVAFSLIPSNLLALVREKPDQDVIDGIQNLLDQAKALQESDYQNTIAKIETQFGLRDAKGKRLSPPPDTYSESPVGRRMYLSALQNFETQHRDAIRSLVTSDKAEEYGNAVEAHKLEARQAAELRKQAIKDTLEAFDLIPLATRRIILSGPPKTKAPGRVPGHIDEVAEWQPTYSAKVPGNGWGETDCSGHTIIGPEAFKSVGRLAFTLDHEGRHFRDITTPDKVLWNVPGNEVGLRKETARDRKTIFGLSDDDIKQQDKMTWIYRGAAAVWTLKKWGGKDPYDLKERAESFVMPTNSPEELRRKMVTPDVAAELERIRRTTEDLETQVERGTAERKEAMKRREREEQENWERRKRERAVALAKTAYKACDSPDSLFEDDFNPFEWNSFGIGDFPADALPLMEMTELLCVEKVFAVLKQRDSRPILHDIQDYARSLHECKFRVNVAQKLASLAQRACNSPEAISPETMKELLACFPNGIYAAWDGGPDCAHDLYNELMGYNVKWYWGEKPRLDWLVREAQRLNQQYAPPPPRPAPLTPPPSQKPQPFIDPDPDSRERPGNRRKCLDPDPNTGIIGCPP